MTDDCLVCGTCGGYDVRTSLVHIPRSEASYCNNCKSVCDLVPGEYFAERLKTSRDQGYTSTRDGLACIRFESPTLERYWLAGAIAYLQGRLYEVKKDLSETPQDNVTKDNE